MGFVGAGFMGQLAHIGNYAMLDGCELAALAEPRPELARLVAERHGFARVYADHRELAADPDVDAVAAILPQALVTPVVRDLLAAGKHVITEKPMGVRSDDCREVAQMAADAGLVYQVGYDGFLSVEIFREEYWLDEHASIIRNAKTTLDAVIAEAFGKA